MNKTFKSNTLFRSFGVKGGLIEQLYPTPDKQLILYSQSQIRIYSINIALKNNEPQFTVLLIDQITLHTNIHTIQFIQDQMYSGAPYLGKLAIINDLGQLSILTPIYPYDHRILALPSHFGNSKFTMQSTLNRLTIFLQQDYDLLVYIQTSKHDFHHSSIDLRRFGTGEVVQIQSTLDGYLYILSHSYDFHDEKFQYQNTRTGFINSQGIIKTTIQSLKLINFTQNKTYEYQSTHHHPKLLVNQIIPLESDQVLMLTSRSLLYTKAGLIDQFLNIQFAQELSKDSFMTHIPNKSQILISSSPSIQIIQLTYDSWGSIEAITTLQLVKCTPGLIDIVISQITFQDKPYQVLWMQTDIGASYLSYIQEKQKPVIPSVNTNRVEPQVMKKIKLEDSKDYSFKIINYFSTLKKIYGFAQVNQQNYILAGGQSKQSIYKITQGVNLIKNLQTNSFTNYLKQQLEQFSIKSLHLADDGTLLLHDGTKILLHKIYQGSPEIITQHLTVIDESNVPIQFGKIASKIKYSHYIQFEDKIQLIDLNQPGSYQHYLYKIKRMEQILNYFIGLDEKNKLVLISYENEQFKEYPFDQLAHNLFIKEISHFSIATLDSHLMVLLIGNNMLQLFQQSQDDLFVCLFSCANYNYGIPALSCNSTPGQEMQSFIINFILKQDLLQLLAQASSQNITNLSQIFGKKQSMENCQFLVRLLFSQF